MKDFLPDFINEYIDLFYNEHSGKLGTLEKQVREEGLPVAKKDTIALLECICHLKNPRRVLEIGTCVGFSALCIRDACPNAEIDTIDRYKYMIDRAKVNFKSFGADNINLIEGQASDILPGLKSGYDLIYLDAAKGQYPRFLPICLNLLNPGGVMVSDNILCGGIVAGAPIEGRRDKTVVKRMNEFVNMIKENDNLLKALIPAGDGIMVVIKKGGTQC